MSNPASRIIAVESHATEYRRYQIVGQSTCGYSYPTSSELQVQCSLTAEPDAKLPLESSA